MNIRPSSTSNVTARRNQMPFRDVGEINQSTKLGKRGRNDHDKPEFPIIKPRKDEQTERQRQQDLSKTKYYNCGQMGHIKAQYILSYNEAGKV